MRVQLPRPLAVLVPARWGTAPILVGALLACSDALWARPQSAAGLPPVLVDSSVSDGWRLVGEAEFLESQAPPLVQEALSQLASELEVPQPALRAQLAAWERLAPTLRYELRLEDAGASRVLLEGTERIRPGRPLVVGQLASWLALVDYDVEVAQFAATSDPQVVALAAGTGLALLVDPLESGAWRVAWVARTIEPGPAETLDMQPAPFGSAQRNPLAFAQAGAVTRVDEGREALLRFPGIGAASLRLALRVDPGPGGPVPLSARVESVSAHLHPALARPLAGFARPPTLAVHPHDAFAAEPPELEPLSSDPERLAELDAERDGGREDLDELWNDVAHYEESGLLLAKGPRVADLMALFERLSAWYGRPYRIALALDVELPGAAPRALAAVELGTLAELPCAFSAGAARELLLDWDVEIAQAARIPDPILRFVDEGVAGTLAVRSDEIGRPIGVQADLSVTVLGELRSKVLTLDSTRDLGVLMVSGNADGSGAGVPRDARLPPVRVPIELPQRAELRILGELPLAPQGAVQAVELERSADRLWGPGARLRLRIEVS